MAGTIEMTDGRVKVRSLLHAATGSWAEGFCGAIAVLTAIIGLAGAAPRGMACATSILLGCAFLIEGGALSGLVNFFASEPEIEAKLGGATGAEFFGGWTGLVCGIMAAFGTSPLVLLPMAPVVFGGTLMMGSAVFSPIDRLPVPLSTGREEPSYRRRSFTLAAGTEVIAGLAALILGMFALTHWDNVAKLTWALIALLCAAISVTMGGGAASRRIRLGYTR